MAYVRPAHRADAFNCPYCGTYAVMHWRYHIGTAREDGCEQAKVFWLPIEEPDFDNLQDLETSTCNRCKGIAVWHNGEMVEPLGVSAPPAHRSLPADCRDDYAEARAILERSPKGAAAMLRLVVQKLCVHLGEEGKNINHDIGELVKKGLPEEIQMALDTVRVVGNDSVHPGQIDVRDTPEVCARLFELVNFIVQRMIHEPAEIARIYGALPPDKRAGIKGRDGKS
ncbi:MAG: DUF4145 domain-containing protein [Rhodospirillales bacterium]|nr:DUF4145 domain-containing protein [Rhodospirillales bacterium]